MNYQYATCCRIFKTMTESIYTIVYPDIYTSNPNLKDSATRYILIALNIVSHNLKTAHVLVSWYHIHALTVLLNHKFCSDMLCALELNNMPVKSIWMLDKFLAPTQHECIYSSRLGLDCYGFLFNPASDGGSNINEIGFESMLPFLPLFPNDYPWNTLVFSSIVKHSMNKSDRIIIKLSNFNLIT